MSPSSSRHCARRFPDLIDEWSRIRELAALGVLPKPALLALWPPRASARRCSPSISADGSGYRSSRPGWTDWCHRFLGTTARNIGTLFDFANRYRCILFLDEFDAVAKARDDIQEVGEIKRLVNSLLQCLDARGNTGFTLAATNHEHLLDPAVWRRFDGRIEIGLPDREARCNLLHRFLQPLELTQDEINMLIWLTGGMSGADLKTLVEGGKRFLVLQQPKGRNAARKSTGQSMLPSLQRQAILNGHLFGPDRRALLLGPAEDLAAAFVECADLTQRAAGAIVGISQSTVSRRLRELAEAGEGAEF